MSNNYDWQVRKLPVTAFNKSTIVTQKEGKHEVLLPIQELLRHCQKELNKTALYSYERRLNKLKTLHYDSAGITLLRFVKEHMKVMVMMRKKNFLKN